MEQNEIKQLARKVIFQNRLLKGKLLETHISWIILTKESAFKIKKPVKLSFLDFSSLSLRKKYCEKELRLNSRLTDIYLDVVPIYSSGTAYYFGDEHGEIKDYAVRMKKMQQAKRMDNLLKKGQVNTGEMRLLAKKIAAFHGTARKISTGYDPQFSRNIFNDLAESKEYCSKKLGNNYADQITDAVQWSNQFLKSHGTRFQERIDSGWKRDLHGDLHSGNIFLYKDPVIFDCIEFNDSYRKIDVLYEIAFMCMDLEAYGQPGLAQTFLEAYLKKLPCMEKPEDEMLFTYFKSVRANIRAKVHCTSACQAQTEEEERSHLEEIKKYLDLMRGYINTGFQQDR